MSGLDITNLRFVSLAATPLADALLLIDVILKAAQSLVSRVCVTIALYHI